MKVDQLISLENFVDKGQYVKLNAFINFEPVQKVLKQERFERILVF